MKDKVSVFTSTGCKLIHHPEAIARLQSHQMAMPISVQIAPTSRCQLNCIFCSNVNRKTHQDLDNFKLSEFLYEMSCANAKTIEWTGGGDPTLYYHINESIEEAEALGFEQGFITNGLGFDNIMEKSLSFLTWMRISMNSLDYKERIEIPELPDTVTLGFSYVMNDLTSNETLARLRLHVEKYKPEYVRIVPNCQATEEEQNENNAYFSQLVESWGYPYFYQEKVFNRPLFCYWGYFKPFLLHDEYVYRCSSVVLNSSADRSFHENYRWCHMKDFPKKYHELLEPYEPIHCDHCVFEGQNELVHSIVHPNKMTKFV